MAQLTFKKGKPNLITRALKKQRTFSGYWQKRKSQRFKALKVWCFEDGGVTWEGLGQLYCSREQTLAARNWILPTTWVSMEADYSPRPLDKKSAAWLTPWYQPCKTLSGESSRNYLYFWPTQLWDNKWCCYKPLSMWLKIEIANGLGQCSPSLLTGCQWRLSGESGILYPAWWNQTTNGSSHLICWHVVSGDQMGSLHLYLHAPSSAVVSDPATSPTREWGRSSREGSWGKRVIKAV